MSNNFQPVYSNPADGELITQCKILEAVSASSGSSAVSSGSISTGFGTLTVGTKDFGTLAFSTTAATSGTITISGSVDGVNFFNTSYVALASGNTSASFNAATATVGQIDTVALTAVRFTASSLVGNIVINTVGSAAVSNIMLDNPIPAGTNVIGGVTLAKAATATRSEFTDDTDTRIADASATRPSLAIYNNGPAILYIGQGSTAVTTSNFTYLLNPSDTYIANPNEVGLEHRGIFAASGSTAEVTIGA
jgi:hypothetical protein